MAAAMAAQQPVSAEIVGNAFAKQYYYILHHLPGMVHLFYQDISQLGRPEDDGSMSITTTMQQQAFCFGFVEFDEANATQNAIEASPLEIGGCRQAIEENKSTNSQGNTRGRFQTGRGSGFRNEGVRGRGSYGGGRGYGGDFNARNEFGHRGGIWGGVMDI